MQDFMPGTQPQGTHAFDPDSSSGQSMTQMLNTIDVEADEMEDQVEPPLNSSVASLPAAFTPTLPSVTHSRDSARGYMGWVGRVRARVTPKVPTENPYPKGGFGGFHIYKLIQYNIIYLQFFNATFSLPRQNWGNVRYST